ncbi:hypothetical protein GCM10011506_30310 [Marivirga lumbricoides]|uniref:Uncharacterized protein n=1 Tax=Marivirga lumbricoides TaxID=1046115 RepID=A0ABQ1MM82_9BACT|nr:hypothetical protein GCM10011506_30310 [Marivirga lumbricoides]
MIVIPAKMNARPAISDFSPKGATTEKMISDLSSKMNKTLENKLVKIIIRYTKYSILGFKPFRSIRRNVPYKSQKIWHNPAIINENVKRLCQILLKGESSAKYIVPKERNR